MLAGKFLDICREKLFEIEEEEMATIDGIAQAISDAVVRGAKVFIYDRGHLLNNELMVRAGGFALLKKLNVNQGSIPDPITETGYDRSTKLEFSGKAAIIQEYERKLAEISLVNAGLCAGDILIIGSVSGKASIVVELALAAGKLGIITIGITSLKYSKAIVSSHHSGKKLFEAVDYVIDNHSDIGDASMQVEGLDEKICPTSGINAAIIAWCLMAQIAEYLIGKGIRPGIYRSVNLPGGEELFNQINERYKRVGY